MAIKQLSIFVENKPGRLVNVMNTLAQNNIDVSALSLADTLEYGVLRLIVDKPEKAVICLKEIGVFVKITEVLAVTVDDVPGGLASMLEIISNEDIEVSYMYAFVGKLSGKAITVLKVSDPEKAKEVLKNKNITMLSENDAYRA